MHHASTLLCTGWRLTDQEALQLDLILLSSVPVVQHHLECKVGHVMLQGQRVLETDVISCQKYSLKNRMLAWAYPSIGFAGNPEGAVLVLREAVQEAQQELECVLGSPLIAHHPVA